MKIEVTMEVKSILYEAASNTLPKCSERPVIL